MPVKKTKSAAKKSTDEKPKISSKKSLAGKKTDKPVLSAKKIPMVKKSNTREEKIDKQLTSIYQDFYNKPEKMTKIEMKKRHPVLKFLFLTVFIGGLMAAIAWAGLFLLPSQEKFAEEKINLSVSGPQTAQIGVTSTYKIIYSNDQSQSLKNVTLTVKYPESFVFLDSSSPSSNEGHTEWDLGEITSGQKGELDISGIIYGSMNEEESWRVFLTYKPEKYNYQLQKAGALNVELGESPFEVSITGPSKAVIGEDVEYVFTVKKEGAGKGILELKPSWSTGFFIVSAEPKMDIGNKWVIDTNTSTEEWTFALKGKFDSTEEKESSAAAILSLRGDSTKALASSQISADLEKNDMDLKLAINGKTANFGVKPEEDLNYTINLKNNNPDELQNITVKLRVDGPSISRRSALNWSDISDEYDGNITGVQLSDDVRRGEITWDEEIIPSLAMLKSKEEINVNVYLPLKSSSNFDFTDSESDTIEVGAIVIFTDPDGNEKTLTSNPIKITVNSDLSFKAETEKIEDNKYQITWLLSNSVHPLENLKIESDVYGQTELILEGEPPAGSFNFDTENKKAVWKIPEYNLAMPDSLPLKFSLTISEPNPSQEVLMSKVVLEAIDKKTGEIIRLENEEVKL